MNQKQPLNIKINKKEVFLWNASNNLTQIWINYWKKEWNEDGRKHEWINEWINERMKG